MNDLNVDGEIQKTQKQVFHDHKEHLKMLKRMLKYIHALRARAVELYGGDEIVYRQSVSGRALEEHIGSQEKEIRDRMRTLQRNFGFHYANNVTRMAKEGKGNPANTTKDIERYNEIKKKQDPKSSLKKPRPKAIAGKMASVLRVNFDETVLESEVESS